MSNTVYVDASSNFDAFKFAMHYAFGCCGTMRPILKGRGTWMLTMTDDVNDYHLSFLKLNYDYVQKLPVSDIIAFNQEDFGCFFYEFGRTILANLVTVLSKADWNSISEDSSQPASYLGDYYSSLLTLDNHVDQVVKEFEKVACSDTEYDARVCFDYHEAVRIIKREKDIIAGSRYSKDMCNADIFYVAYIGLLFTNWGLLLLFPTFNETNRDVFSFTKSAKSSSSIVSLVSDIIKSQTDDKTKKKIVNLLYAYGKMSTFLKIVSGLSLETPFIGTINDVAEGVVKAIEKGDGAENILDNEIFDASGVAGVSLKTITEIYDPIMEINRFRAQGIIEGDWCNIFDFGKVYYDSFVPCKDDLEAGDYADALNYIIENSDVPLHSYLKRALKPRYTNEEVEMGFVAVKNILTGIDIAEKLARVDPGIVFQLVMMAGAFRILQSRTTQRSTRARNLVNSAIDILDMIILKIHETWFYSGKYFNQVPRPVYGDGKACNQTLKVLHDEFDHILVTYIEFVRWGVTNSESAITSEEDKTTYKTYKNRWYRFAGDVHDIINDCFTTASPEVFLASCAQKNTRTIVQCAFLADTEYDFNRLVQEFAKKDLARSFVASLAVDPEEYTGIDILDRIINSSYDVMKDADDRIENYIVGVYATIYEAIDLLFRKFNIGNYFDFGNADGSAKSYKIEDVVRNLVAIPLKKYVTIAGL